jgi:sec-independent protein translocase protein TatC
MGKPQTPPPSNSMPWVSHLVEMRDRLVKALLGVLVVFIPLSFFSKDLFTLLAGPLLVFLPEGTSMIATEVASPFLTPFKLSLLAALVLAMPWVLHQVWGFIAPGLYQHERRIAVPLLVSSVALFYAGIAFAYYVVFPLVFGFLTSMAPEGVTIATDIGRYLDFVIALFLAFGLAFEVPIATVLMVWTGITTPSKLKEKRPYVFLGAFVAGMFLTPPDVISQTLLAVPMYVLFESGIIMARLLVPGIKEREQQDAARAKEQSS